MATQTWQVKALAATQGSQFGAIIKCALAHNNHSIPRFYGCATVTSDGFIMCGFVDRNGDDRGSSFVGSKDDLTRNFRGLSDHLKLNDRDRANFRRCLARWIRTDYSEA